MGLFDTVRSGDPRMPPDTRSLRWPWLRPALFLLVIALLPFTWVEQTHPGCGGQPRAVRLETGADLLFAGEGAVLLIGGGVAASLLLLAGSRHANPVARLVVHIAAVLANAWVTFMLYFMIHFSMVQQRVLWPAWLATFVVFATTVEALVRSVLASIELVRERRRQSR